ncbi:TnsD family Tn7-like transposition protein [Methylomonas methanica]|uniref:Transposition protein n=1 Tax=Methylomonas methanica (strain DSM 25384 / MC09) TaxID=857087 RepID=G0A4U2_METMM|nr:TnsD family Tn7-like transposition protein [Methylomonas methanica]AEG02833.1 transposition protein [Methylomonas methanica MC09]
MLGFPIPYPHELLYSTIARAGVHDGETSPKQLLDSVFDDRKVIATVDLPSHIEKIAAQYPENLGLVAEKLIGEHTLWPLYSPFIPEQRGRAIKQWMMSKSYGSAHLASGIAASRIKHKLALYLCPACMDEQKAEYGEAYWDRRWQVPLIRLCGKHGPLQESNIRLNEEHRHAFVDISEVQCSIELDVSDNDRRFTTLAIPLLQNDILKSPTYHQWTLLYQAFAGEYGCLEGKRIDHRQLFRKYISRWGASWLQQSNLMPDITETSWLRGIFRKHRKSFSFAEHITVVDALSAGQITISQAIQRALLFPSEEPKRKKLIRVSEPSNSKDQIQWLAAISEKSPKQARQEHPALYARLYRTRYVWLMQVNAGNRVPYPNQNKRVNWNDRDRQTAKKLMQMITELEEDLSLPRLSRSFLLHQLPNTASIEKNLNKLPRCRTILKYYSETIAEYQIRRLTVAAVKQRMDGLDIRRWSLLRQAGLSDERMTEIANIFLNGLLTE